MRSRNGLDVVCPFCGECDFDLIGLKLHLKAGHCEVWNATEDYIRPAPDAGKDHKQCEEEV